MSKTKFVILHETTKKSLKSDAGTFLMFCAMVGFAYALGMERAETYALVSFTIWILWSAATPQSKRRMSPDEARAEIARIEREEMGK